MREESAESRQRYVVEAADACLRVLMFVSENPHLTLTEIQSRLGLNKSRTLRLLATLEARNLVVRDKTERWSLGVEALLIGNAAAAQLNIAALIQPYLDSLRDRAQETAQFRLLSGRQTYCIAKAETHHAVRVHTVIGRPRPLYIGSSKAILAFADRELFDSVVASGMESFTEQTLTPEELRKQLDEIRARGYSISRGEAVPGALALGAPIFDAGGSVVGCLSLLGPEARLGERLEEVAPMLVETAREVSDFIGFQRS